MAACQNPWVITPTRRQAHPPIRGEREGSSSSKSDTYVPGIDGLRTVAVLSAMIYHLKAGALLGGFVGVDVFFMISGFVVTLSIHKKRFASVTALLAYFYARRLINIAPARRFLLSLSQLGVHVVIEAPTPVFRLPPFRCSDWFNRANPVCDAGFSVRRREIDDRRAASVEIATRMAATIPGVTLWDPLPVLCDLQQCSAYDQSGSLFLTEII